MFHKTKPSFKLLFSVSNFCWFFLVAYAKFDVISIMNESKPLVKSHVPSAFVLMAVFTVKMM